MLMSTNVEVNKPSDKDIKSSNETQNKLQPAFKGELSRYQRTKTKIVNFYQKTKKEFIHYYHGFKLLFLDLKVTFGIMNRLTMGHKLSRRERKQLVRTTADLIRVIPFIVFIAVPCMELLLPAYIKFFPFLLPSTFKEESKEKEKMLQVMKGKFEMAKFLQETMAESTKKMDSNVDINMKTFSDFLKQVREQGLTANTEDILRFSQLFEDEVTLESLEIKQLKGLCNLLSINAIGPAPVLRFQLRLRVRQLQADDKLIFAEGIDKVPVWELQQMCRERGMRAVGVSEARLRYQLSQWLELHLEKKVPITLLLLTRVMYLPETLTTEEQLKQAIFILPNMVSNQAKLNVARSQDTVDSKTKIEIIKEEQKVIYEERKQRKEEAKIIAETETPDKAPIVEPEMPIADKAPFIPIIQTIDVAKNTSPQINPEISAADLAHIESAIVSLEESESKFQHQELKSLKEIQKKIMTTPEIVTEKSDPKRDKIAQRLNRKVDRIIGDVDNMMEDLYKEKTVLLNNIKEKESIIEEKGIRKDDGNELLKVIKEDKDKLIDIDDVMMSLKKIQKVPQEMKWEQILAVLDDNRDGKIDKEHAIKVIKLLIAENVKMTSDGIAKAMEVINKESQIEKMTTESDPKTNDSLVDKK